MKFFISHHRACYLELTHESEQVYRCFYYVWTKFVIPVSQLVKLNTWTNQYCQMMQN